MSSRSTPIVAGTREWWLETLEEWAEEQTEHEATIESLIGCRDHSMPAMGAVHRIITGASAERTQVQIPGTISTISYSGLGFRSNPRSYTRKLVMA